jgi:hypothetical protein
VGKRGCDTPGMQLLWSKHGFDQQFWCARRDLNPRPIDP